ncbi:MAG TPA: hypothetical protein VGD60_10340 [Candidatus Acidoferrales bacterium]
MRLNLLCLGLLAVLAAPVGVRAQRPDQPQQPPVNEPDKVKTPPPAAQTTPPPPPVPPAQIAPQPAGDSLAAAARKAREAKKDQAQNKPAQVFDNDNIPTQGGVSAIGQGDAGSSGEAGATADGSAPAAAAGGAPGPNDEKAWRDKFAELRHKLQQDEDALSVMQRELGVLDVQYYNDPNKALQQNLTRSDINEKTAKIDAGKQKVAADNQAISDLEDQLRRAGGDIGWSR